jgi:hypothetical protein
MQHVQTQEDAQSRAASLGFAVSRLQPGEIVRSGLGRFQRANGFTHFHTLVALRTFAGLVLTGDNHSIIEQYAALQGVSALALIREHSLLPFLAFLARPDSTKEQPWPWPQVVRNALTVPRAAAYFCRDCVAADLGDRRTSYGYWRRMHQLPGRLWCHEHGTVLSFTKDADALLQDPACFVDSAQRCDSLADMSEQHARMVARFLQFVDRLTELAQPMSPRGFVQLVNDRLRQRGYRRAATGSLAPLVSDAVLQSYSRPWLREVFPRIVEKRSGEFFRCIDGSAAGNYQASSVARCLPLPLLFDSPEELLSSKQRSHFWPSADQPRSRGGKRPRGAVVIDAMVKHGLDVTKIAIELGSTEKETRRMLASIGARELIGQLGTSEGKALSQYVWNGRPLGGQGANQTQLDDFVRICVLRVLRMGPWPDAS